MHLMYAGLIIQFYFGFKEERKAYNKETADIGRPIPLRGLIRGTNDGHRRFYELNQQSFFLFHGRTYLLFVFHIRYKYTLREDMDDNGK